MSIFSDLSQQAFKLVSSTAGDMLKKQGVSLIGDMLKGGSQKAIEAVTGAVEKSTGIDMAGIIKDGREATETEQKALQEFELNNADMLRLQIETDLAKYNTQHETIQTEIKSDNFFKSGWRPSIGWVMAYQFFMLTNILFFGAIRAMFSETLTFTDFCIDFGGLLGECTVLLLAESSALGINMIMRSRDKKLKAGDTSPGVIGSLINRFK
jgi:hypothetical protein